MSAILVMFSNCTDPDIVMKAEDELFTKKGGLVAVVDKTSSFFDLEDLSSSNFAATVVSTGDDPGNVEVFLSLNGENESKLTDISSFPSPINMTLDEATALVGTTPEEIKIGDEFVLRFETTSDFTNGKEVPILATCRTDLAGDYTAEVTYFFHDFLADYPSNTMEMEVTSEGGTSYSITDLSGGLYSSGPYVGAYGTTDFPFTFDDICKEIRWTDQVDAFGQDVLTVDGSPSFIDDDGVISITVFLSVYGESWTIVLTPVE